MSKVTRYDLNQDVATGTSEMSPVPDSFEGPFVRYEDYAAMELLKEQYLNNWAKAEKKNSSLEVTCDELEARVKELEALSEELRADSHEAAKVAGTNAGRAQRAEAELARLKAQEPIYQILIYGDWCDTDKGEYKASTPSERRKVYTEPRPAVPQRLVVKLPPVQRIGDNPDSYFNEQVYDAEETREAILAAGGEIAE